MVDKTNIPIELEPKRHFWLVDLVIRLVKGKPLGIIGGVIILVAIIAAIFAEVIAPYGYNECFLKEGVYPPSAENLMGTDVAGRDVLSRIIYGARVSMIVGLGATSLCLLVATIIGLVSGFLGGRVDTAVQRLVDAVMCFPSLVLYLILMSMFGRGLLQVILVLGITRGIRGSRVVRSAVIGIRENVYVEAAAAIGVPTWRILARHILPNVMAPIIVLFTVTMGSMILAEATLSFLGFGIPPPMPSWGGMLSGQGRRYMYQAPWLALYPGLALSSTVFGVNMLGDAIRDLLDPRLRGGLGRYGVRKKKETKARGGSAQKG